MDSDLTGKSHTNVKFTGSLTVNNGVKIQVNGFQVRAEKPQKLKVTYNALQYELSDIEGHLVLNRVYE
mgnify:CR=1 FL=1